ncbi:hypothetical protein ACFFF5_19055 [Lederbergia wuyishanensis]|uniref:DUF4352 domain-containing protein n=1 Tax=Lederbergia wuyishanensis TaxID=1347903 RepID=A0ABU0D5H9_9BACI|nr:hypothetical protein [Lederbergia wuyishanensis]MCJ8009788.1 hypothetical protein [Lederbergia wuyishanensis]MDQ0343644.1 hypothetical protein [Lederbergia wuyishanensis]
MKKKLMIFTMVFLLLVLSACGPSNETSNQKDNNATPDAVENESKTGETTANKEDDNQDEVEQKSETEEENSSEEADGEVLESTTSSNETDSTDDQPSENMLEGKKIIKYDGDSVIYTIESATFNNKVTTSNPKDDSVARTILSDNEIYLHVKGTIENETKDSVPYAGSLGLIRFLVIYDGKHEFDGYGAVEEEDGSDFKGSSSVDAFTTRKVHYYSKLPLAVSKSDKPLDLIVYAGKEEYKIKLR